MEVKIDTHTHTLASGHAYNTIREMAAMAKQKGLEGLAITEHAPKMPGSCGLYYFQNLSVVPRHMADLRLLFGVELNILDAEGTVDLPPETIRGLDLAIASIHPPCYGKSGGRAENTRTYVNVMHLDYVDIIGHPDDGRYAPDYDVLARTAKETGTLLEINNSSLRPGGFRENTHDNALELLACCKKYGTMITLGSDAHVDMDIARTDYSARLLAEAGFPEELVANTSCEKLLSNLKRNRRQTR